MMRVTVEADPLNVEVNALELILELAEVMPDYYAGALLRGRTPDGGAMPLNKQGMPLGLGKGTIATQWQTSTPSGTPTLATFSTGPFQEGGYHYPVRALVERGASPVGDEGLAGALIAEVVSRSADRAVGL